MGLLLVGAPPALADTMYRGTTSQGYRASMNVLTDGTIQYVQLRHRAPCRRRGFRYGPRTDHYRTVPDDPIERDGDRFSDGPSGGSTVRQGKGRNRLRYVLNGRFLDDGRVVGSQRFRARIYRRGELIDVCRATVRFTLRPV